MKKAKTITCATLSAMVMLMIVFAGTAYGITGNYTPDSSPYVGVVVLFSDAARTTPIGYCSGVLISPTIMLTAGHATLGAAAASVCFDKGPINYSIENGKLIYPTSEVIYTGTPVTYPEYAQSVMTGSNQGDHLFDVSDVGIIILDTAVPVSEVTTYATLAPVGFDNTLPNKTTLEVVGYGMQTQVTPKNNGPINSWVGTLSCNVAQAQLVSGHFAGSDNYLKLTANPSQDKGGVAFGDSGGPVIYNNNGQDTLLAINSDVTNANCNGVTYHTRIDTTQIINWINGYLS